MKKILPILITLMLVNLLSFSQIKVSKVIDNNTIGKDYGLYYTLPQTTFKIDFLIKQTQYKKGPFAEYCKQILGSDDYISHDHSSYEIIEISVSKVIAPDPDFVYFVKFNERSRFKSVELSLNKGNGLQGYNSVHKKSKQEIGSYNENTFIPIVGNTGLHADTVIRKISLDTTTITQTFIKNIDANKSALQQAREISSEIKKIDESIMNLITGYHEIAFDKGSIEFMYNKLNELKHRYTQLYTGISNTYYKSYTYYYTPSFSNTNESLFKFSNSEGVLPLISYSSGDEVTVVVQPIKNDEFAISDYKTINEEEALFYRIPELVKLSINKQNYSIFSSTEEVNQLGKIGKISTEKLNNVVLDEKTGGIKYIKLLQN
ncbi:MAG: DUF4831 family protein [Lentimicrobiaceae bacterium]|nr:DUF4831 family protein [Lentimicrobiaceae bacterium]